MVGLSDVTTPATGAYEWLKGNSSFVRGAAGVLEPQAKDAAAFTGSVADFATGGWRDVTVDGLAEGATHVVKSIGSHIAGDLSARWDNTRDTYSKAYVDGTLLSTAAARMVAGADEAVRFAVSDEAVDNTIKMGNAVKNGDGQGALLAAGAVTAAVAGGVAAKLRKLHIAEWNERQPIYVDTHVTVRDLDFSQDAQYSRSDRTEHAALTMYNSPQDFIFDNPRWSLDEDVTDVVSKIDAMTRPETSGIWVNSAATRSKKKFWGGETEARSVYSMKIGSNTGVQERSGDAATAIIRSANDLISK